jgi:hypothetical protein
MSEVQDSENFHKDWEAVGGFMFLSMHEVAIELGGEELAERISLEATSDAPLPNPDALRMLEKLHPGAAEQVMTRSEEIQKETHERELADLRKPSLRKYGKAITEGVASLTFK